MGLEDRDGDVIRMDWRRAFYSLLYARLEGIVALLLGYSTGGKSVFLLVLWHWTRSYGYQGPIIGYQKIMNLLCRTGTRS